MHAHLLGESLSLPSSLWAQTAIAAPDCPPLQGESAADVLIIGAGFTGLSAAISLAEQGKSVVVLDAAEPGWGASGRNNGQVIAGLKQDPDVIERLYPGEVGEKMVAFSSRAPDVVFDLIAKYGMDCHAVRKGWIQPAFSAKGERAVRKRARLWQERGIATQLLEGKTLHQMLGTDKYHIAWLDPRGGCVQPLSYSRALAAVALSLGVRVHGRSKVEGLRMQGGQWLAQTAQGHAGAKSVIVATGAYAETLVPGLRRSFVPVRTAQVASAPLPQELRSRILPQGHVASDTRELLTSFRQSPDGRLVMGGSGATAGLDHRGVVPYLQKAGRELFGEIDWQYQWSGYFAVTTDHLPHIHEPQQGMHIAVGCNGRGIAISTALGIELAKRALGESADALPILVSDIRGVPFHAFRHIGVAAATRFKRLQDYYDK